MTDEESDLMKCIKNAAESTDDPGFKDSIINVANDIEESIDGLEKNDELPRNIEVAMSAIKLFCKTPKKYRKTGKNLCSSFVRDVLKDAGFKFKNDPNAAAFNNDSDGAFKKSYGPDLPETEDKEVGYIVSAGSEDTQQPNTAHVGIHLGHGIYIGHSPSVDPPEVVGPVDGSEIRIRPLGQIDRHYPPLLHQFNNRKTIK